MPSLTKLYELVILQHLNKEIKEKDLMPKIQRGFKDNVSTLDNLIDVIKLIDVARRTQQEYRVAKIPVNQRVKTNVLFVDF